MEKVRPKFETEQLFVADCLGRRARKPSFLSGLNNVRLAEDAAL
ncbi:MAG: hypothetical protein ACPIE8_04405 [Henriciella sp.]